MSLRHAALGLLSRRPASGYDLLKVFDASMANVWPATQSQLYGALNKLADGVLTFYVAPNQYPGRIQYDVYGYLPGTYRALPASIRSAYDPGRSHLGPVGEIRVLAPGEQKETPKAAGKKRRRR